MFKLAARSASQQLRRSTTHCTPSRTFTKSTPTQQTYRRFDNRSSAAGSRIAANKPLIIVVGSGGACYVVYHTERVPTTGRLRFIDVSESAERQMGDQAAEQVLQQYRRQILPRSDPRVRLVEKVAQRILDASVRFLAA